MLPHHETDHAALPREVVTFADHQYSFPVGCMVDLLSRFAGGPRHENKMAALDRIARFQRNDFDRAVADVFATEYVRDDVEGGSIRNHTDAVGRSSGESLRRPVGEPQEIEKIAR